MDLNGVIQNYGTVIEGGYAVVTNNLDGTVAQKKLYGDLALTVLIYTKDYVYTLGVLTSWQITVDVTGEVFTGSAADSDDINDLLAHRTAIDPHKSRLVYERVISYGDPQPIDAFVIDANHRVVSINVRTLVGFDGLNPSVIIGTPGNPSLFFVAADSELVVSDQSFSKEFAAVGDSLEAVVLSCDSRERRISLSIKSMHAAVEKAEFEQYMGGSQGQATSNFGELLQQEMKNKNNN